MQQLRHWLSSYSSLLCFCNLEYCGKVVSENIFFLFVLESCLGIIAWQNMEDENVKFSGALHRVNHLLDGHQICVKWLMEAGHLYEPNKVIESLSQYGSMYLGKELLQSLYIQTSVCRKAGDKVQFDMLAQVSVPYYPTYKHPLTISTCAYIRDISTCADISSIIINQ